MGQKNKQPSYHIGFMYSELSNKRADQNKQVWRADVFISSWKKKVWWEKFLICDMKIKSMVAKNFK